LVAHEDDYATVRVHVPQAREPHALATAADALEALAGLVAEDPEVGGVETRGPDTLDGPPRPEIVIYTVPGALARVAARARDLAAQLELEVGVDATTHVGERWRDRWKEFFPAQVLGAATLLLRPSWIERREGDPARELVLDPGRAFGTGLHETTQLCLEALVDLFERGASFLRVLDLGCGSGILALAAARLFTQAQVLAVDVDPEATETTRENVALNQLEARVHVLTGTIDDVEGVPYTLVVANIRRDVLLPHAAAIVARTSSDLVLGGILDEEAAEVETTYRALGMHAHAHRRRGMWVGLHLRREPGP
jgi:ribosomal protein L11 methyltransferase